MEETPNQERSRDERTPPATTSRCADWLSEGQSRVVEYGDVRIVVRYVGRKGRRGRIVIEAPAGAAFS